MARLFVGALRETLNRLDAQTDAVKPVSLLQATRMAFPQFAQTTTTPGGQQIPMQQDAEEFYSGLLTLLAGETSQDAIVEAALTSTKNGSSNGSSATKFEGVHNMVDALFGMKMKQTLTCDEVPVAKNGDGAGGEPPVVSYDLHRKLVCNIQGGAQTGTGTSAAAGATSSADKNPNNVTHIYEGIALGLRGSIEKHSDVLGRNAVWTKTQRMARLPAILTVQFGRFYWKATPDSQDHAGVKCKVMKAVTFGTDLDVYDFCTEEVQAVLKESRAKTLALEEDRINKKLKGEIVGESKDDAADKKDVSMEVADGSAGAEAMETEEDDEEAAALKAALAMSLGQEGEAKGETAMTLVGPGLPDNFEGFYELFAVVTHKGRDADGGHYMSFVQLDEGWFVFDDDEVSPCTIEDVLKLKGGGDWHMSYLNFYRAKK